MRRKLERTNQIIYPPIDGWRNKTYYVVEISMSLNNPIHQDIFYSGFINHESMPAAYNALMNANVSIESVQYLKVIRVIDKSIDNEHKMIKDVAPEYFI